MIINKVGEVAKKRGLNIAGLAASADITYKTAYEIYEDRIKRIGLDILDKLCEALDADPGELFVRVPATVNKEEEITKEN